MDARRKERIDARGFSHGMAAPRVVQEGGPSRGSRVPRRRPQPKTGTLNSDCVIVIPCFNESRRLDAGAFREFVLDHENVSFLFVNDGSSDGTAELLDELAKSNPARLFVLHLERNRGKAEAVRRGMLEAADLSCRFAGFWDADLATPLEAIPEFMDHLDEYPDVQMVFGARVRLLGRQIERRPIRHYLGRIFATAVSFVLGVPLYDTQCGAKLFRCTPEVVRLFEAPFRSRWIFDVEIVARFVSGRQISQAGALIHETPLLQWRDIAGSKVRPRDFLRAFFELWAIGRNYRRSSAAVPVPAAASVTEVVTS